MSESALPNPNEPLNCAFQRRDMGAKKIECVLTESGSSQILFRVVEREACQINICPMYQTWQLMKKQKITEPEEYGPNLSSANLIKCGNCENLFPGTLLECPKCGFSEPIIT